jgi:photoactive yellow protein
MESTDVLSRPGPAGDHHVPAVRRHGFVSPELFDWLESADAHALDALPFGLIAMALDGTVEEYNAIEAKMANLTPERVVGRHFFSSVAPCTNNFMVAHRFETEAEIDAVINYTFTFRVAPQAVRLRLLKREGGRRMYLAVERSV